MIRRYAIKEEGQDYMKFVMEIPIYGISKLKDYYTYMLDPDIGNYDCLVKMAEMVKIIEQQGDYSDSSRG